MKIYCAGPLFNNAERKEMAKIAKELENNGFETFLPQRDSIVAKDTTQLKDIFYIDIYNVMNCDGLVMNMNGRVPDEGAIVETTVAFMQDKPIVLYKSDSRSLFQGSDTPLILGLGGFKVIDDISKLPVEFKDLFELRIFLTPKEVYEVGESRFNKLLQ